ncbi:hypothetical protein LJK87_42350 [Paenibacillus sp. P25]|nr:hypothetical protein LJK87_42350 [Paenibacillus sp. P25]
MNMATTLGSWAAGLLYTVFHGFSAVGVFTAVCLAGSLLTFIASGVLALEAKARREAVS